MLTIFNTPDRALALLQTSWAKLLNPLISNIWTQGQLLTGIELINGTVSVNHKLSRMMQGWSIADVDGAATIYRPDSTPFNDKTLTLTSNAAVTVNIWVF